ncbi:14040_t:CDS:2 [Dentiscutata erythropus]|uniref:14040_t:CDS:1 n=1 Tax=Dentiscutata erythropus TaxID=1348616 RepID=A0A9N9CQ68_9GLOM|nr:14040_t:CDS:2 [Dentiscutata erythropus]
MFLEKAKFWQTGGVCMQVYQFITMLCRIWLKAIIPDYRNSSIYDTSTTTKFPSKNLSDLDGSSNDQSKQISFSSKKILSNNINSQNDNIPNYLKSRKPQHHLKRMESAPVIHTPNILYDNIVITQFIYAEDDVDVNGQTMLESPTTDHRQLKIFSSSKDKRKSLRPRNDPYYVIQTKQPTEFKPYIKDIIPVENPYSYIGTLPSLDIANLHRSFSSAQTIRITGVQNRRNGDAFSTTTSSFQPSKDGTFLLKITKGGKLGRKIDLIDGKKKGGRNWKLYGVILSGSQLMFFKDEAWFNTQMSELKNGKSPKLPVLKPDAILMTADSVAVYDKSYDKYKNVFRLVCPQGHQYLFQAENDIEMNDWISKINYAATFKTVGLKIRNIRSGTSGVSNDKVPISKKHTDGIKFGNSGISRRDAKKGHDKFRTFPRLKEDNAKDAQGRANLLRSKIEELQGKISTLTAQLQNEVRFRNNLFVMIPYKASTRDRIIQIANNVATKLRHTCLELSRLVCYHEILEKDLCATVMEDDRYWLNRRSMYRLCGESSSEDNISLIGSITGGDDRVSAMISTSSLSSMQYSSNGGDSYGGGSSQTTVSQHDEEEFVYRHGNASEFDLGFENVGKDNNLDDDIKDDDVESFTFENNNNNLNNVKVDINSDIDSMKDRSDIIDLQTIDPRIIEALSITDNSPSDVFNNIIKENDSLPLVETNIPKSSIMTSLVIVDDYEVTVDDDDEEEEEEEEIFVDSYEFSDSEDDDEFVDAEEYI